LFKGRRPMHAVIVNDLEEYLAGALPPAAQRHFQAHLDACSTCRQAMLDMGEASELLAALKPAADTVEPPAGFVAQVMRPVARRPAPNFWSSFADFSFGRRV